MSSLDVQSLSQVVAGHARDRGSRSALVFLENGEDESGRLSYEDLEARIVSAARGLAASGLPGRGLLIALPAGPDFAVLFLACLRAGVVAIPVPYPDTFRNIARMEGVAFDARPAAIVSDDAGLAKCPGELPRLTLSAIVAAGAHGTIADSHNVAFVQYTSGSTQAPKGIAITNGNLMANLAMIARAALLDDGCVSATWLPHFHDMGLIGGICLPLFLGGTAIVMPPQAFVKRPLRWLGIVHRYQVTLSGGPCFGYDICARRLGGSAALLDLSKWRIAFCGSEPVRAPVLRRFAELLAPAKFNPAAFLPCYGLAEATLMVTCPAPGTGVHEVVLERPAAIGRRSFVSCGPQLPESIIKVCDASGGWANDGELGEICVSGPHVSPGFWSGADSDVRPFPDRLIDDGSSYLRTGDIGALRDGMLVPVDRLKDQIVVYGRKVHAADIESTVLDACRYVSTAAAIGVDYETEERLVVLCEVRQADMVLVAMSDLAATVADVHGILPDVRLLLPGSLARTSSGKVARFASKKRFLEGAFGPTAPRAPAGGVREDDRVRGVQP